MYRINTNPGKAAKEKGHVTYPDDFPTSRPEKILLRGKPEEKIRTLLKSNGFKWAPSQRAWQRQITGNGKYALNKVIEKLKEMELEG